MERDDLGFFRMRVMTTSGVNYRTGIMAFSFQDDVLFSKGGC